MGIAQSGEEQGSPRGRTFSLVLRKVLVSIKQCSKEPHWQPHQLCALLVTSVDGHFQESPLATGACCLPTSTAVRWLAGIICGTPKASKHGLLGEVPSIGAGSSIKRKFKNTCHIRALKLVAGWKEPNKGSWH